MPRGSETGVVRLPVPASSQRPVEYRAITMLHTRLSSRECEASAQSVWRFEGPASAKLLLSRLGDWSSRRRGYRSLFHPATIFFLAAICGCGSGDGLNRQSVSGAVTCDGKPVPNGAILFEPATQESGTAVGATIREGAFVISGTQGPVPGSYRVRIYMSSGVQAPRAKGQTDRSSRPMVELLPARYNAKSELRADVSGRRPNRFRFDLSSSESDDVRQQASP